MEKKGKVFDEFDEHKHIIDLGKIDELGGRCSICN